MKYLGLLLSSVAVLFIMIINLYYNSVALDITKIKDYVFESNIILEEVINKEDNIEAKKEEYITRLMAIKRGIQNSKTTFLIENYKVYRIKTIEGMIKIISDKKNRNIYIEEVNKYNKLAEKELDKILNKKFIKVT